MAQPNASASTQGYGYDQYNRLSNIVSATGNFISQYWSNGSYSLPDRVQYLSLLCDQSGSYGTGGRVEHAFDDLARFTGTASNQDYAVLNQHSDAINAANRRTQQTISDGNAAGNTHCTDYTYDDIGQLKSAKGTDHVYDYGVGDYVHAARLQEQFG